MQKQTKKTSAFTGFALMSAKGPKIAQQSQQFVSRPRRQEFRGAGLVRRAASHAAGLVDNVRRRLELRDDFAAGANFCTKFINSRGAVVT